MIILQIFKYVLIDRRQTLYCRQLHRINCIDHGQGSQVEVRPQNHFSFLIIEPMSDVFLQMFKCWQLLVKGFFVLHSKREQPLWQIQKVAFEMERFKWFFQNELFHQALGRGGPVRWPHQRPHRHHLEDHHFMGGGPSGLQAHQISTGAYSTLVQ